MKSITTVLFAGVVMGAVLASGAVYFVSLTKPSEAVEDSKPLYWVAPMDPTYRRDEPGKSPMGMDLVPVFENAGSDDGAGVVSISPVVQNNLGVRTELVKGGSL